MNAGDRARIDRLEAQVARLSAEIATLRTRQRADPEAAACLLREIAAAIGERLFTSAELAAHAELPEAAALHAGILTAVGSASPRRIGKWLSRHEGRNLGGLAVHRIDDERAGLVWKVVAAGLRV